MNKGEETLIRGAQEGDFAEIKRLVQLLFADQQKYDKKFFDMNWAESEAGASYVTSWIRKMISGRNFRTYVISCGSKLHGFISLAIVKPSDVDPERKNIKLAEIDSVFIERTYRGRGYGEEMALRLFEWAKERGVNRLRVGAYYDNHHGIGFYRKLGFEAHELVLERDLE